MAEATAHSPTRPQQYVHLIGRLLAGAIVAALGVLIATHLAFFVVHAAHLLRYPYPLDYGEGPLLAQVNLLRSGTPIWSLYADPDRPPYAIANYPPVYHLVTTLLTLPLGNALLAGRLISLAAALAVVVTLWLLTEEPRTGTRRVNQEPDVATGGRFSILGSRFLVILAFLALPIVREWSVLMRVDMLGVCLGLWGLVIVQRHLGHKAVLWAALPLTLSLLVKPSLIAAPTAALVWLLFRDWRRALALGALMALGGGVSAALLQLGSGGWFLLHVLAANANVWDRALAYGFWHDQLVILWPLVAAAVVGTIAQLFRQEPRTTQRVPARRVNQEPAAAILGSRFSVLLALYYTLFGAIVAYGVGKVGAYTNYFLEFYAGLIWLAALAAGRWTMDDGRTTKEREPSSIVYRLSSITPLIVAALVIGALPRYYPTWSANYLKLAGIIEGRNPPRMIVGGYGVWQDLQREHDILATLSGVNAALSDEVRAAGEPIFTDVPGVAAQVGQLARLQAFEYRQLLDAGLADQRPLLRDLANGQVPLVALDYLGNWLTPEMIAMITHRYAQDGSLGTYDLYRPLDPGPLVTAHVAFANGLQLVGYHLAPPPGRRIPTPRPEPVEGKARAAYHAGETALLTLEWRRMPRTQNQEPRTEDAVEVLVQVTDRRGHTLLATIRPLLYGALAPSDWGDAAVQHMQPIVLPPELPAGDYEIAITTRIRGRNLAPPQALGWLVVEGPAGRLLGERGYYVPAPLLDAWTRLGGDEGPGDAQMPAVPFRSYTLQCFARACLRLVGGDVQRLPLGQLVHLADVGLRQAPTRGAVEAIRFPDTGQVLAGVFLDYWRDHGGADVLGPPITAELIRGDRTVQYTRYARLERPVAGGPVRLGRLGEEYLRLPGGVAYRWP